MRLATVASADLLVRQGEERGGERIGMGRVAGRGRREGSEKEIV